VSRRSRSLAISALTALTLLGLASGAQATPMSVTFTVVNDRGINQFSYYKHPTDGGFYSYTDGNGQFTVSVSQGDHILFSRDGNQNPSGGPAPEDPAGFDYVVNGNTSQTITLPHTTGDSTHTSLSNTESWIVGKLNQDRAAHNPPIAPLHVSSTLNLAAYAIAHDRALAANHPYPPPYANVNLADWGWPGPGFLDEDSPLPSPEATLAHWDGTAGDAESVGLAHFGVFDPNNTAVGVADGGGTWIIEYNDCSPSSAGFWPVASGFISRCGMTSDTGDPTAYTPPPAGTGGGGTIGGTTPGGSTPAGATTPGAGTSAPTGTAALSSGGGSLSVGGSSGPPLTSTGSGVTVTLDCTGVTGKTCSGQVSVSMHERTNGSKVMGVLARSRHSKARTVRVTVGLARYTIAAGQIKKVTVALNATGRSLLKRFHRLTVTVVVGVSTATGMTQLASRTVTIKAAAAHKRHKK
jgi:hypothetical protein